MGDIGLLKQGWKWLQSQKQAVMGTHMAVRGIGDGLSYLVGHHWPSVYSWCQKLGVFLSMVLVRWRDCVVSGFQSSIGLGSAALFVILWSCFISLTSLSCLVYVLLILGAAGATIRYLGYTPGLFIVGLFGILTMWIYGNFWITGMLFIVGGYMFFLNNARPLLFMSTAYCVYCVYVRVGWVGVFLSTNLAFLSNNLLTSILQGYDCMCESARCEESKKSEPLEQESSENCDSSTPASEAEDHSCKSCKTSSAENVVKIEKDHSSSQEVKSDASSLDEMKRVMNSSNHYEILGFPRNKIIDPTILKKEYRKKAVLVHPDKNMGIPLASESFKKLQSAYEVLSDVTMKRNYDEQLRKEESKIISEMSYSFSQQDGVEFRSEESRCIECTKCGNSHIWICTNRSKAKARWCQDCHQYHQAKDGDGWVEFGFSTFISSSREVEIPRAFVCAESKIFDASEWAICQGIACSPNTHLPSFHVNMVGLDKSTHRSNPSRFPCGLDAEKISEDEEFDIWLQQALSSGLFSESSQRRKSWSPFKISQTKGIMRQLRRFS
uniref:DnaJ subfamily C member 14 n=3 Tax=Anthurium amnicola TaxID=1678845 RepID=A0A1D1YEW2_9ARAE